MSNAIRGFVPAVVTPFNEQGEIRFSDFEKILNHLVAIGADGICLAGDNGESWALSLAKKKELLATARKAVGRNVSLILGASAATTVQAIKYAEVAAELDADAILLMPQ